MRPEKRASSPSPASIKRSPSRDSNRKEARGAPDAVARSPEAPRTGAPAAVDPEERRKRIAERAYYKALDRGFGGGEVERDWLEAEREIDEEPARDRAPKT